MATTPASTNSLISALRGNTGPMTDNRGVTYWEFDYNGMPLTFGNRTPGGANNPDILKMPSEMPATPQTPAAPDPIEQPIQVDVPVVDIPAPPLDEDPVPDPDPVVDPEPEPEVEVIPVPDPDPIIVTEIPPAEDPPKEDPPKTGTVTVELLDEDTGDFVDVNEVELGGGEGSPPVDEDFIELGGGEGDKVGTVTIEDFTPENPAVIRNDEAPVIRDILNEQIDAPVGTVTIEPVSDNVDVGIIDPADNDPFGWDEWLDPAAEDPIIITAADNDPFGWDQYEDPAGGDDVVPVTPTEEELEELEQLMLLMDAL